MWGHNSKLLAKLVILNSLVILFVILLAGLSVKDYACFLVNSEQVTGQLLVSSLNGFLFKISIVAFLIVGLFHYFTVKKILRPIKQLSEAAKKMKEGHPPEKVDSSASGELQELIDNFNSMAETIYSVQEQREEMLKDIAHELRTPLTNINGYLEGLQNEVIDGDPELFGSLLEESRRITRIVELLTELNSWSHGTYFFEKQFDSVEVDKVMTETFTAFKWKLENLSAIQMNLEPAEILGNADGLRQVFTNLIQNFLDYRTQGDLTVTGKKTETHYVISFTHHGQYIDPEKKDLIFERFYRVDEARSTKSDGAGLGLAIAKSIISAHKGTIGLTTDGTEHHFQIEFPLHQA
ncbi:two-component system sensor histidine kinase BaeS [Bacillus ectoiniformans]|uniref:HAMP domain-containing sensor histidine kinase n=1 Tax=Bacillus ectoiniformans TaxID=1494429 RepID=UPI001EF82F66|nr:HAMP domain-containing sensor histidine kinase [Bacillus ectoiniformans]MBM7647465.1 two-component system sensor histidine kinase BaeS [Bacillus ectoiniformans]